MARVDSLLSILAQQGANELRLGTDKEPKMLAFGAAKRLSVPTTPEDTLRELLGEILTPERDQVVRTQGRAEVIYEAPGIGVFQVKLSARPGGFDVVFLRQGRPGLAAVISAHGPASATAPTPAVAFAPPAAVPHVEGERGRALQPALAPFASPGELAPGPAHDEAPTPGLLRLLAAAFALRASDLHLTDGQPPLVRVDGTLQRLAEEAVDLASLVGASLCKSFSADASIDAPGTGRARLHVFRTSTGMAAAVRLLPASAPSLASLHLPVPLEDLIALPHGLVLVCGATGSGKSTTLAALAQEALRRRSIVLSTLEDPIEHGLVPSETSLVRRRQVGRDARDFASGLRDALREDPDVLLVGEMRDPDTIGLALTAAETGHLVLSSLHSGSAASAVERIVDAYPPGRQAQIRVQLADSLRVVVVQRLLPRARGTGRIVAMEVLRVTHAVASMIREGKTAQIATAMQSGRREGMISLERCLADRVQAGEVRMEDARAASNDPASLSLYMAKPDR
jgi:twitching motility protein PilT